MSAPPMAAQAKKMAVTPILGQNGGYVGLNVNINVNNSYAV